MIPTRYHPDFPEGTANGLFRSDGSVLFSFNAHLLDHFCPGVAEMSDHPDDQSRVAREERAIGFGVSPEAFAISLMLINRATDHRLALPKPKWPSTKVLTDLIQFIDGYSVFFVADELLATTRPVPTDDGEAPVLGDNGAIAFERYAFACATKSPYIEKELSGTLPFDHTDMSEWALETLSEANPHGLADLYKAHLDNREPPKKDDGGASTKRKRTQGETRASVIAAVLSRPHRP